MIKREQSVPFQAEGLFFFLQETIQLKPRKPFPMISLLLVIIMKAPGSFFFRKFRSWTAWLRFMTVRMMNFC